MGTRALLTAKDGPVVALTLDRPDAATWSSRPRSDEAMDANGVTKYVATSTPLDRDWANATMLDGLPPIRLELIRSETSPAGYLLVDYRVIR
jgi:hypothetical protein